MIRRVFFSFHHKRDVWRVSQVRNCGLGRDREAVGFWDAAEWEKLKLQGERAVRQWIDDNFVSTSVTSVLIGFETWQRPWVRYEIIKSLEQGKGLLGIHIHNIKNSLGQPDMQGSNPFDQIYFRRSEDGRSAYIWEWIGSQWVQYSPITTIPASSLRIVGSAKEGKLSQFVSCYDWINNDGRNNVGTWVENAAALVGR